MTLATNVPDSLYELTATSIDGEPISLSAFEGRVMLIVNVASRCGYTPQYEGLEKLYRDHRDEGLIVLGFPCDQFGRQEPGTEEQIKEFCSLTYGVTFPMFAKVDVNGDDAHPVFVLLKSRKRGLLGTEGIKWNFTKFLVGRDGQVIRRYGPADTPASLERDVVDALRAPTR